MASTGLASQIDGYLKSKGSPLAGFGEVFVAAGKKYGVDPRLVVGISGAESGFGLHNFAAHNAWGWAVHQGKSFTSWPEAISTVTQGLGDGYISQGMTTPAEIVKHYAPSSDGNDESVWSGNVSTFMRELGATPARTTQVVKVTPPPAPTPTVPAVPKTEEFKLPKFPQLLAPPSPSNSGLQSALISNLQQIAQRGHASPSSMLSGILQGKLADVQTDQTNQSGYDAYAAAVKAAQDAATSAIKTAQAAPPPTRSTTSATTKSAPEPAPKSAPEPSTPTTQPASGKVIGTPYSGTHTLGNWESDNAVDIALPYGTPVRAVADGKIGTQFGSLGSSGRFAGLRLHLEGADNEWYYAHLSKFAPGIEPGAEVKAGQVIGYSGEANGVNHLHFGQEHGDPLTRYR